LQAEGYEAADATAFVIADVEYMSTKAVGCGSLSVPSTVPYQTVISH